MNENPITNATGLSAVIPKDNDGYCTVYKLDCADGLGLMTVYQVYPGIQLIYNDFEATSCYWDGNIVLLSGALPTTRAGVQPEFRCCSMKTSRQNQHIIPSWTM